ncbi:PREDICTED: uncharacterized protein LOC106299315 [Brassica oleracea var. oleracea]|uniref:Zinc finger PHD-type domain-containing protein n=1 Tax=Brassica oleracea var. oleracea TaxID=109376 RepID=A0A0D3CYP0_BRAOL|nr:PREDICTED: uncharacterized protein LOC106299315 [Brassica oleracea var. oleracea]
MDPLNHVPSCLLLCPTERYEKEHTKPAKTIKGGISFQFNYRIVKSSRFSEKSDNLHSLLRCSKTDNEELYCDACGIRIVIDTYYFCSHCNREYHNECVEASSIFHFSGHPKHPLQLLWSMEYPNHICSSCQRYSRGLSYYCLICDFSLHVTCSRNLTPLAIDNPKRHKHTLHYFPRRLALACDVCALVEDSDHLYACLLCDFFVHKSCMDLPFVIKVSRHNHRLAFAPSSPFKASADCRVCYEKIDINYGEYSCVKGCVYAMHSRCALRRDVSDGKELEGEPEETYENTKLFEDKGDGVILHQGHPCHQIKLEKQFHDENKHCQACMLPFYGDGNVYRCMQSCDFILHESCAYLPRVKQFMLHVHPLILELAYTTSCFMCRKCDRNSCGFAYVCPIEGCDWKLDTLCASICEPFNHYSHPHPLFITCGEYTSMLCSICQSWQEQPLDCVECSFVLCFRCATLPHKLSYKHDEHLLVFSYKEYADDDELCWCEICEKDVIPQQGLYACNECEVTLHVDCLLGRDLHMKSGQTVVTSNKEMIHYLPNTYPTRPICKTCGRHCPYKIMIKTSGGDLFCSYTCYEE